MALVPPPAFIDTPHAGRASFAAPASIETRTVPFWLWWNLLSLDAPTVAVLWAVLFARVCSVRLSVWTGLCLALVVWLIYVLDRLLDASHPSTSSALQARHHFCFEHASFFLIPMIAATTGIVWTALRYLQSHEMWNGIKLGCIVVLYMVGIHAWSGRLAKYLPKEVVVGIFFAVGTTLPLWSRLPSFSWSMILCWVSFTLVCILNCTAIECWETPRDRTTLHPSPRALIRWTDPILGRLALLLGILSLIPVLLHVQGHSTRASAAVCATALFLFLIDSYRTKLSPEALRVLADAALVFPVFFVLVFPSSR